MTRKIMADRMLPVTQGFTAKRPFHCVSWKSKRVKHADEEKEKEERRSGQAISLQK